MRGENGIEPVDGHPPPTSARARVPEHVVYRSFTQETVLLNLETGTYHGLNATAGRMLEALQHAPSIAAAAARVAVELGQPPALIERDLITLCGSLRARGLIDVDEDGEL